MDKRHQWLVAVVLGMLIARKLPDGLDDWVLVALGVVFTGMGLAKPGRSRTELTGYVLAGAGLVMFGLAPAVNLSFVQELLVGGGLVALGLAAIGWGRGQAPRPPADARQP